MTENNAPAIQGKSTLREVFEWAQAIILAILVAYLIRTFVFTLVLVEGPSMQPTLFSGDRLFVSKMYYQPKNGDIVVFRPPNDPARPYIKRVIATEGQTIDINYQTSTVYVDGVALDETYIKEKEMLIRGDMIFPAVVPEDSVFVMGDNRNDSRDSRRTEVGMVAKKTIMGKAILRFWPYNTFSTL